MPLMIYGKGVFPSTRRVVLICRELGIAYQLIEIERDVTWAKEYMETRQPFGQTPYIDDDGFLLYESRAISRYLTLKHGKDSGLLPSQDDIVATAKFEVSASIEQSDFDPFVSGIVFEKFYAKYFGSSTNEERVKELTEKLDVKLQGYDRILSKSKYLAGESLTLADLFHLPYGYMLETVIGSQLLQKYPNVARWWNSLISRPSWEKVKNLA